MNVRLFSVFFGLFFLTSNAYAYRDAIVLHDDIGVHESPFSTKSPSIHTYNTGDTTQVHDEQRQASSGNGGDLVWFRVKSGAGAVDGWIDGTKILVIADRNLFHGFAYSSATQDQVLQWNRHGAELLDREKLKILESLDYVKRAMRNPNVGVRKHIAKRAFWVLQKGEDLLDLWVGFQKDSDPDVRNIATQNLNYRAHAIRETLNTKKFINHVREIVYNEKASLQELNSVIWLLQSAGVSDQETLLIHAAGRGSYPALNMLGHINSSKTREVILKALENPDERVRFNVLGIVSQHFGEDAVKIMIKRYAVETPGMRSRILMHLSRKSNDSMARAKIRDVLVDPMSSSIVRQQALNSAFTLLQNSNREDDPVIGWLRQAYDKSNEDARVEMVSGSCSRVRTQKIYLGVQALFFRAADDAASSKPYNSVLTCFDNLIKYSQREQQNPNRYRNPSADDWRDGWTDVQLKKIRNAKRRAELASLRDRIYSPGIQRSPRPRWPEVPSPTP